MKLTNILFRFRAFKIPGNRFIGKVRFVKIVTPMALNDLRTDYKIEEQNMLYLRHPFLTLDQSRRLTRELKKEELKPLIPKVIAVDEKFAKKSTTLEDKLKILLTKNDWDVIN